ncbi:hypothetical protein BOC35_19945 [Burkholderia pseudomallei]|nr:hypothetical protein BOC35_19945 [Burkholderia pseudomallei]RPE24211.1 hypothetical protein DF127_03205 [Burkholderia pseudomallei]RPE25931.1 hypothetical protein DF068_00355 [Burkholderia pseudomallei]RQT00103.1 hypothetical protein DF125_00355 [Burkholderia pseudomallei]
MVALNLCKILKAIASGGRMSNLNQRLRSVVPLVRRDLIEQVRTPSMELALEKQFPCFLPRFR